MFCRGAEAGVKAHDREAARVCAALIPVRPRLRSRHPGNVTLWISLGPKKPETPYERTAIRTATNEIWPLGFREAIYT